MFLSNFSIKRPIAAVVIIITLMGLGLIAMNKLRVNQFPDVDQPVMVVNITYPGASPDTVEREIINRVERAMQGIEGVDQSRSSSTASEGNARFVLVFEFHKDMTQASDEVRNAIGSVRYKLPVEMREPVLTRVDPNSQPVMQLALSSQSMSHAEISRLAEDQLADRFRALPGVATVNVNGSLTRELSVLLHAQKLREYGVSVTDVVNALRAQNATAPVGKVRGALEDQSIRLVGRFESPAEFNQMLIKRSGDNLIRLGQVATVEDGFAEMGSYSERNGRPNVGISVTRTREASTVSVAKEVRELVDVVNKEQGARTELVITQDGGKDAQNSLDNVVDALFFGAGLTIAVVYVFLNSWRSTLITGLSLPTSVITAFIAVWLCGFTLNFMSLLGFTMAQGAIPVPASTWGPSAFVLIRRLQAHLSAVLVDPGSEAQQAYAHAQLMRSFQVESPSGRFSVAEGPGGFCIQTAQTHERVWDVATSDPAWPELSEEQQAHAMQGDLLGLQAVLDSSLAPARPRTGHSHAGAMFKCDGWLPSGLGVLCRAFGEPPGIFPCVEGAALPPSLQCFWFA